MYTTRIARRVPRRKELTKSVLENAKLYGLTVEEYRQSCLDWLQNEGYDEWGNEYNDVYEWLTIPHAPRHPKDDPFDGGRGAGMLGYPEE